MYLSKQKLPDITYDISCAARYMVCPRLVYIHALKQIGHNMKATSGIGLIMKPSDKLTKIDSFQDADFAGMYRHEDIDDPVCVKSRTGYVILDADCPFMWYPNCNLQPLYYGSQDCSSS